MSNNSEEKIEELEKKLASMEENVKFLKDLLTHIHSQFQEFKKDVERKQ
jgi:chromosome segregation ATPase